MISTPTTEHNGSRKPYTVWKNMLYRCYSEKNVAYERYGGVGVKVSDAWHCYDTFRADIETLKGFDEDLFFNGNLQLDKDGLSGEEKIYSKETCQFLTPTENIRLATFKKYLPHLTKTRLVALSPTDEVYCIVNIPMFADEHDLLRSAIHGTLIPNGQKTHRGWCFKKVVDHREIVQIDRKDFLPSRHGVIPLMYDVLKNGEIIETLSNVEEAAKYMKCSVSNINQRTRDNKEYHKHGVVLIRRLKE